MLLAEAEVGNLDLIEIQVLGQIQFQMTTFFPSSASLCFVNVAGSECYDGDHDDASDPPLHIFMSAILTVPFFSFSNRSLTLNKFLKALVAEESGSLPAKSSPIRIKEMFLKYLCSDQIFLKHNISPTPCLVWG